MPALTRIGSVVLLFALGSAWPGAVFGGRAAEVRKEAFQLLNEGVSAYNRGLYPDAVAALRRAAAISLNSFRAHYYLGLALHKSRRYEDAVAAFEVALDLDPQHLQALVGLGDAHLKLGHIDDARASYFRALKLLSGYAAGLDGLARSYEAQGQENRALEYYAQAIASDRGFAPAFTHLGDLYMRQGKIRDAVRLLEEAVAIRPDYAPGLNRLAAAYGALALTNEAVATIHRAIELEPTNPLHLSTLGQLQLGRGALAAAEASFDEALALEPNLSQAWAGMGEVARRRGEYDLALERIGRAVDAAASDAAATHSLEEFRTAVAQERTRAAEITTRIATNDATAEERSALARLLAGRGRFDEAADVQAGLPFSDDQQERLAYLLVLSGRYREGERIYADLASRTLLASARVNEGVTLALLGDDERALDAFRVALESDPEQLPARLYLSNALLRSGQTRAAAEGYRRYLDDGGSGQAAERVRRILKQIAADLLPVEPVPALPVPPPSAPPPSTDPTEGPSS